jgi:hypothetical protein
MERVPVTHPLHLGLGVSQGTRNRQEEDEELY